MSRLDFAVFTLQLAGLAKRGETLGFTIFRGKDGHLKTWNYSELNMDLIPSGKLPDKIVDAIKEVLK